MVGEWLSEQEWTQWGTFTFADPLTHASARRQFSRFVDSPRFCLPPDRVAWASEDGKLLGRTHVHALLWWRKPHRPDATDMWRSWFDSWGRAEVEEYDPEKGASHYVAKYVAKPDRCDWDVATPKPLQPDDNLPI